MGQGEPTAVVAANLTTSSADDNPECNICLEDVGKLVAAKSDRIISPCDCAGSLKWIHRRCLAKWMKSKQDPRHCDICGFKYRTERFWMRVSRWQLELAPEEKTKLMWDASMAVMVLLAYVGAFALCPMLFSMFAARADSFSYSLNVVYRIFCAINFASKLILVALPFVPPFPTLLYYDRWPFYKRIYLRFRRASSKTVIVNAS